MIWTFLVLMLLVGSQMKQARKEHPRQVTELLRMMLIWGCMSDPLMTRCVQRTFEEI